MGLRKSKIVAKGLGCIRIYMVLVLRYGMFGIFYHFHRDISNFIIDIIVT